MNSRFFTICLTLCTIMCACMFVFSSCGDDDGLPDDTNCGDYCLDWVDCYNENAGLDTYYYEECCRAGDPCDWANNTTCDCEGAFNWDDADCKVPNYYSCLSRCEDRYVEAKVKKCTAALMAWQECRINFDITCLSDDEYNCYYQYLSLWECLQ